MTAMESLDTGFEEMSLATGETKGISPDLTGSLPHLKKQFAGQFFHTIRGDRADLKDPLRKVGGFLITVRMGPDRYHSGQPILRNPFPFLSPLPCPPASVENPEDTVVSAQQFPGPVEGQLLDCTTGLPFTG